VRKILSLSNGVQRSAVLMLRLRLLSSAPISLFVFARPV
jgi:hypothetical protein